MCLIFHLYRPIFQSLHHVLFYPARGPSEENGDYGVGGEKIQDVSNKTVYFGFFVLRD